MLFLSLLATRLLHITAAFHCSSDLASKELVNEFEVEKNSMATKMRSINSLFIFDRPCACDYDWKHAFCSRLKAYRRLNILEAPTVCICRQFDGLKAGCSQFLTRCFPSDSDVYGSRKAKNSLNTCNCCFNQPDEFCNHLDCNNLRPTFGQSTNTSCLCYTQANYPDWICNNNKRSTVKSKNGPNMVRLYNSLLEDNSHSSKAWPYAENVAFVEETNQKRRIQNSQEEPVLPARNPQTQPRSGFVLNEILVELPLLFASCIVLLGLLGFLCFLFFVTRMQPKDSNTNGANGEVVYNNGRPRSPRWGYDNPESPKHSAVILQNKLEKNAVRLTHTIASPKHQLLKPTVRFSVEPRTREIVELDYTKPCNCSNKKAGVTLTV